MRKIFIQVLGLLFFTNFLFSQDAPQVILTIEDLEIPAGDYLHFVDQYDPEGLQSNRHNAAKFTDHQLKLYEARQIGCDTAQSYVADLNQYRDYLSQDYLNYDRLDKARIEEYYQRRQKELEISHILIRITGDIYSDTLSAYNKIYSIRQQIIDGADFNLMALKYSHAGSAKDSGYMSFVSGMEMNYPLEELAYTTQAGSVSEILRTSTAYHILKVHHERSKNNVIPIKSRAEVKQFYSGNPSRNNYLHDKFLRDVMGRYGFSFDKEAYAQFVEYGRESFQEGKWIEPADLTEERILFTIGDQSITFSDFSSYLTKQQFAYSFINYPPVVGKHFQAFFFLTIKSYQDQHLEIGYPEFKAKMKIYSSALLTKCIEDKYWEETATAEALLKDYYLKHSDSYIAREDGSIVPYDEVITDVIIDYHQATEEKRNAELRAKFKHQFHSKVFRRIKKAMRQI